ncbi:glycosyltransferase [Glutamicibacter arilaitensis]|uniref:glycosyltransferase n=1 Tax=Glutamicibacter arilaitensis TaxID=256701 RepID=UPI003FD65793
MNGVQRVLVLVGTDHHPFDRLVQLLDRWYLQQCERGEQLVCEIQYGTSNAPQHASGYRFLERRELDERMAQADLVVCHGGPSTIIELLRAGMFPLVMPRDPQRGEHVDGHQQRFAAHMQRRGMIEIIDSPADLDAGMQRVRSDHYDQVLKALDLPDPSVAAHKLAALVDQLCARGGKGILR